MFAVKNSTEIDTETQRLNIICTVFQAELCRIIILDPKSTPENLLLSNQRWLQSSTTCYCKQAHNTSFRRCHQIENNWTKEHYFDHLPVGQRTCRPEKQWEGRLLGQNSRELQYYRRLQHNSNKSRKAETGRVLHKTLERNIHTLCKCIHTKLFIPTIFPSPLTQIHSHTIPNKSQQFPFITPQNEQDALANLQLSQKGCKTAHHLMTECSLFSSERPTVLQTLPPPLVLKCHINTIGITNFIRNIFHTLQQQLKDNQTLSKLQNNVLINYWLDSQRQYGTLVLICAQPL